MELRHLRYFDAVASALSFSRAAERLHMSQPPLSRQIRQLEEELGAELIDRANRPMALTPAGRFFHDQAQQMLQRMAEVERATRRIAQGRRAWFGIGFVPSTLYGALPELIRRMRDGHPDVEVGLQEMMTIEQGEALKAGVIDVGFGRLPLSDPAISCETIAEEPLMVAVPAGHGFAHRSAVGLAELAREPLILYPARPRPSYADQVLAVFRDRGLLPQVVLEANELQTAIGLVSAGVGLALVPASVQRLHRDDVVYLPLSDAGVRSPVIMNTRKGDRSEGLAAFRTLVAAVAARGPG
ncbi:MAG: LysR family transcriptional regulator [Xylophilus ampelinus]